jgi:uncharacterized protein (TIGR00369 family)
MAKPKPSHGHAVHGKPRPRKNHCFACGKDNADGMHLKFYLDEAARHAICKFKLSRKYTGPPGHAHGGIIATILDEAMGKVNRFRNVLALTSSMEIRYLKPVPLGKPLTVTGYEQSMEGRKHINVAEISNEAGVVLARSTGTFIAIDPEKMFPGLIKGLVKGTAAASGPTAPNR